MQITISLKYNPADYEPADGSYVFGDMFSYMPDPVVARVQDDGLYDDTTYYPPERCASVTVWTDAADQRFSTEEMAEVIGLMKAGYPIRRVDFTSPAGEKMLGGAITVSEAAEILGVNRFRVHAIIRAGQLPSSRKIGRDWFLARKEVEEFAKKDRPAHRPASLSPGGGDGRAAGPGGQKKRRRRVRLV